MVNGSWTMLNFDDDCPLYSLRRDINTCSKGALVGGTMNARMAWRGSKIGGREQLGPIFLVLKKFKLFSMTSSAQPYMFKTILVHTNFQMTILPHILFPKIWVLPHRFLDDRILIPNQVKQGQDLTNNHQCWFFWFLWFCANLLTCCHGTPGWSPPALNAACSQGSRMPALPSAPIAGATMVCSKGRMISSASVQRSSTLDA